MKSPPNLKTMSELSPAARAVWEAAMNTPDHMPYEYDIAAALRAAADQVVPENGDINMLHRVHQSVRYHLLAIAAELEGHV
jgi:hypothetical protein